MQETELSISQEYEEKVNKLTPISLVAIVTSVTGYKICYSSNKDITTYNDIECICAIDLTQINVTSVGEKENFIMLKIFTSLKNIYLDGATIELILVMQNSTPLHFFKGYIINVNFFEDISILKIASLSYLLRQGIGEMFSPLCRAELGDDKCRKHLADFTFDGKVKTIINNKTFIGDHVIKPLGFFQNGIISFKSGNNNGFKYRVLNEQEGNINLLTNPTFRIENNDDYSITAGCNKTLAACRDIFNNIINFRGEPFIQSNND